MAGQVCSVRGACVALAIAAFASAASAQSASESGAIEEVIVTAQRVAEGMQDVPIPVTALTGEMLEEEQVITPSDLQMNAPNVSFTATNFGGSSFSIRGIGNLVVANSGQSGVSTHINEVSVVSNLNSIEFFDMERVEILRGPQGTLFGRNATGGAINFVTQMPKQGVFEGFVDVETGDYAHTRLKAAVNVPLADTAALRLAGYRLTRDGYIENLAFGQTDMAGNRLPGIDGDIDGRDVLALRGTLSWEITDRAGAWLQFHMLDEDDDRVRISNQVCVRNTIPTNGCLANGFGFDTPHFGATTGGIFAGGVGALPLGTDGSEAALLDFPRPSITGFREMHTDLDPVFQERDDIIAWGFDYDFGELMLDIIGAVQKSEGLSRQDYFMDVGPRLLPTDLNPQGIWPVSAPAGGAGTFWTSDTCNVAAGTAGLFGGCELPVDGTRAFAYDQNDGSQDYRTVEAKLRSGLDGPINFLVGGNVYTQEDVSDYYVLGNTLDLVSTYGAPLFELPPLYPGMFNNSSSPDKGTVSEGSSLFGEVYYDMNEDVSLTVGVRYNEDRRESNETSVLFNSIDMNAVLGGYFGAGPIWIRQELSGDFVGQLLALAADPTAPPPEVSEATARLLAFHDATDIYNAGLADAAGAVGAVVLAPLVGSFVELGLISHEQLPVFVADSGLPPLYQATLLTLLSQDPAAIAADPGLAAGSAAVRSVADAVGPVPAFNETRFITGSPTESEWKEVSGRAGIDWRISNDSLAYAFVSRGYKPGGFNSPIPPTFQDVSSFTFDAEAVNALELGSKNTLLDGRMRLNGSFFVYDYTGLQITRIRNNASINENIDASILGLEVEGLWRPEVLAGLQLDFSYGWLMSEVDESMSIDPVNRTGGNPEYITLNNIDPGVATGINFVAKEAEITPEVLSCALQVACPPGMAPVGPAALPVPGTTYPVNDAGVAIPAYFSQQFLSAFGVETAEGIPVSLDGNRLPNAPEHSVTVGVAQTWPISALSGSLTVRWDYYWQGASYAREFNTTGDEIEAWGQHNASLIFESDDGRWLVKGWVRNIADDENVTGKYLTSDTSGLFRNYFLTEPRLFGVSVRFGFGR